MEAWADARSADGAGLAGGVSAGARAVGLPGGDGIVAASIDVRDATEAFGAEVFSATSTAGPALFRESLRRHAKPTAAPGRDTISRRRSRGDAMSFDGSVGSLRSASADRATPRPRRDDRGRRGSRRSRSPQAAHGAAAFSRVSGFRWRRRARRATRTRRHSSVRVRRSWWPSRGTLPCRRVSRRRHRRLGHARRVFRSAAAAWAASDRTLPVRGGSSSRRSWCSPRNTCRWDTPPRAESRPCSAGLGRGARALAADVQAIWCVNRGPRTWRESRRGSTPRRTTRPRTSRGTRTGRATTALVDDRRTRGREGIRGGDHVRGAGLVSPSGPVTIPGNGGRAEFEVEYEYHGKRPRVRGGGEPPAFGAGMEIRTIRSFGRVGMRDDGDDGSRFADRVEGLRRRRRNRFGFASRGFPRRRRALVPMKPLVVRFQARAFTPRLTADEPANLLAYACDACADRSDASYFRSVTLANDAAEEIGFSLTCSDPFQIFDVEASTPQLGLGRETTLARSARAGIEPSEFKTIRAPRPGETCVTVRSRRPRRGRRRRRSPDYVAEGALVVL